MNLAPEWIDWLAAAGAAVVGITWDPHRDAAASISSISVYAAKFLAFGVLMWYALHAVWFTSHGVDPFSDAMLRNIAATKANLVAWAVINAVVSIVFWFLRGRSDRCERG